MAFITLAIDGSCKSRNYLIAKVITPIPPSSLYKAFLPAEAYRLAQRFERHYTSKHGSWLDMAEIEIGVMSRPALGKPLSDLESFSRQVRAWTIKRNSESILTLLKKVFLQPLFDRRKPARRQTFSHEDEIL